MRSKRNSLSYLSTPMMAMLTAILPVGCGSLVEQAQEAGRTNSGMTSQEEAANELYLDDVDDSAAADDDASVDVDVSVQDDISARRLSQMVAMMLDELDADESGDLSLEEFLAGPEKRAESADIDEDMQEKMTTKMTEDFDTFAGDDNLLSSAELSTLLKAVAPRVGRHRHKNFPGRHEARVKQTWEEITTKYDSDGDGMLSQTEYEAMEADREASRPNDRGPGEGHRGGRGEGRPDGRPPFGPPGGFGEGVDHEGGDDVE